MTLSVQYCFFVWLFCSRTADTAIKRTIKRAMKIANNDNDDNEEESKELLQKDGTLTFHKRNLQQPMIEIYKMINLKSSAFM